MGVRAEYSEPSTVCRNGLTYFVYSTYAWQPVCGILGRARRGRPSVIRLVENAYNL